MRRKEANHERTDSPQSHALRQAERRRFVRAATAIVLGDKPGAPHPEQIVETWGDDAMAERVLKAATSPTSTASYPQTEAQRLEARMVAQIGAGLEQQKDFILRIVAGVIAEELGQLRSDLAVAKAFNNNKRGDVVDLPALLLRRRA